MTSIAAKKSTLLHSLFHNGFHLFVIRATFQLSLAITFYFLLRLLGVQRFGVYSTVINLYDTFLPFIVYGFLSIIIREVAKNTQLAWKYFVNIGYLGLLMNVVGTVCLILFCTVANYPAEIKNLVYILALGFYPHFLLLVAEFLFVGIEQVSRFTVFNFIYLLVEKAIIITALFLGCPLMTLMILTVIIRFIFGIFIIILITRVVKADQLRPDIPFSLHLLRISTIFAVESIVSGIFFKMDILFLAKMTSMFETGIFSAMLKVIIFWSMGITSFVSVFYPIAARCFKHQPDKYADLCEIALRAAMVISSLAIIATMCFPQQLVLFLVRVPNKDAVLILQILIAEVLFRVSTGLSGCILCASENPKQNVLSLAIVLPASMLLQYGLIGKYGYLGCAFASLITFILLQIMQFYFIHQRVFKIHFMKSVIKPLLALAIPFCCLLLVKEAAWYLKFLVGMLSYGGLFITLRLLKTNDIKMLRSI